VGKSDRPKITWIPERRLWLCSLREGSFAVGIGDTPQEAYCEWVRAKVQSMIGGYSAFGAMVVPANPFITKRLSIKEIIKGWFK
jgi:hypothetical protein